MNSKVTNCQLDFLFCKICEGITLNLYSMTLPPSGNSLKQIDESSIHIPGRAQTQPVFVHHY